jgi:hypothetical protein
VQIKQEPGKPGPDNKIEVDARGKDASARTDNKVQGVAVTPQGMKTEKTTTMPVHRIDVDTLRMIAPTCP